MSLSLTFCWLSTMTTALHLPRAAQRLRLRHALEESEPKRPGRKPRVVPEALAEKVRAVAREYPWWGYKRIAVVVRRAGGEVSNKQVYKVMKAAGLLQKRRVFHHSADSSDWRRCNSTETVI